MRRKTQRRWRRAHVDARRDAADVDYISRVFCLPDRNRNSSLIFPFFFFFSFSPCCRAQLELMYPLRPGTPYETRPPEKTLTHLLLFQEKKSHACMRLCLFPVRFHAHVWEQRASKTFFFAKTSWQRRTLLHLTAALPLQGVNGRSLPFCITLFSFAESPFVVIVMQLTMKLKSTHPPFFLR